MQKNQLGRNRSHLNERWDAVAVQPVSCLVYNESALIGHMTVAPLPQPAAPLQKTGLEICCWPLVQHPGRARPQERGKRFQAILCGHLENICEHQAPLQRCLCWVLILEAAM